MGKALLYLAQCSRWGNPRAEGRTSLLPCAAPISEDVHTSCDQRVWDALEKKHVLLIPETKCLQPQVKKYRFK